MEFDTRDQPTKEGPLVWEIAALGHGAQTSASFDGAVFLFSPPVGSINNNSLVAAEFIDVRN